MENNSVGQKIKSLRMKSGLTQRELAEKLSMTSGAISNWENNNRLPSIEDLKRLSLFFKVSLSVFDVQIHDYKILTSESAAPELNQTIQLKKIINSCNRYDVSLLVSAILFCLISFVIFKELVFITYFSSLAILLYFISNHITANIRLNSKSTKTLLIPASHQIFYEHVKDDNAIQPVKKRLSYLIKFDLLINILKYPIPIYIVIQFGNIFVNIMVVD